MGKQENYNTTSSCKFSIKFHIILVCKYRKKLLVPPISDDIKNILYDISKMKDTKFTIDVMETDKDHIHLMIDCLPSVCPISDS